MCNYHHTAKPKINRELLDASQTAQTLCTAVPLATVAYGTNAHTGAVGVMLYINEPSEESSTRKIQRQSRQTAEYVKHVSYPEYKGPDIARISIFTRFCIGV